MVQNREDAEPPQGRRLCEQRLRFQSLPGSRAAGGMFSSSQQYDEGDMFNMDRQASSSPTPIWRVSSPISRGRRNRANSSFYTIDPRGLVGGPRSRRERSIRWSGELRPQVAGQPARHRARRRAAWLINQNDSRQGAQAHRRRDERLLRASATTRPTPTPGRRTAGLDVKSTRANVATSGRATPLFDQAHPKPQWREERQGIEVAFARPVGRLRPKRTLARGLVDDGSSRRTRRAGPRAGGGVNEVLLRDDAVTLSHPGGADAVDVDGLIGEGQ